MDLTEWRFAPVLEQDVAPDLVRAVLDVYRKALVVLALEPPEVLWIKHDPDGPYALEEKILGQTHDEQHIVFNVDLDLAEVAEVVAHELRHVWQRKHGYSSGKAERETDAANFGASFAELLRGTTS